MIMPVSLMARLALVLAVGLADRTKEAAAVVAVSAGPTEIWVVVLEGLSSPTQTRTEDRHRCARLARTPPGQCQEDRGRSGVVPLEWFRQPVEGQLTGLEAGWVLRMYLEDRVSLTVEAT